MIEKDREEITTQHPDYLPVVNKQELGKIFAALQKVAKTPKAELSEEDKARVEQFPIRKGNTLEIHRNGRIVLNVTILGVVQGELGRSPLDWIVPIELKDGNKTGISIFGLGMIELITGERSNSRAVIIKKDFQAD